MTTTPTAALVEEADKITEGVPANWTACSCGKCGLVWALGEMHIATVELESGESDCAQPSPEQRRRIMDFMARSRSMMPELAAALRRAEAERDAAIARAVNAEQEQADMERLLDMQHERTRQADELWRKQHNQPLTLPDLGTLIEWLMKRAEQAEAERDAQHALVLRLTAERDALVFHNAEIEEAMLRAADQRDELTATRDLLTDENARLRKERDEAREQLERIANPPIKRLHVEDGEMNVVLDAPEMASIIATVFYDALDEHEAENYLEMTCAKPESPQKRVVITVRKVLGKTPDEMRKKAERELAEARAHIATLELLRRGGH